MEDSAINIDKWQCGIHILYIVDLALIAFNGDEKGIT
jgi:hypothetical protein